VSLTLVATITPKPGRADAVREVLTAAIPKVHQEPGCELYALHEDENGFVFVERWASQEDMGAHGRGETFTSVIAAITDDLAEPVSVRVVRPVPAGDPAKGAV
jgi:quinol monooxygenase YgiN